MGDITLKFKLYSVSTCIIEEDLSEYLKLNIKDKQYNAIYENDSIYKFIVPDTEKSKIFDIRIEHEDYYPKVSNTPIYNNLYRSSVRIFINKTNIPSIYVFSKTAEYPIIELKAQWGIISWHDLYLIEKKYNHDFLSNEYSSAIQKELHEKFKSFPYDIIEKKGSRYICKLPNYQQDEPHELYIFAYISEEEITKYNSVKLCINDYTQVVIDVTLQEALRATTEAARLGWATSYVLQRLWHDNPRDAKEPYELILKDIKDVCKVTKNYKMKYILCHIDFDIKLTKEKISPNGSIYPFSVSLDWEKFYSKFSIIKELDYLDEIISIKFRDAYYSWIDYCFKKNGFRVIDRYINYMLVVNVNEINNGKTKNNDIFDITYWSL